MAKRMRQVASSAPAPAAVADRRDEPTATDTWSDEKVASRAYEIYKARGGTDGRDLDDWLQAEAELRQRRKPRGQESRERG
jgi:hypothetical protein